MPERLQRRVEIRHFLKPIIDLTMLGPHRIAAEARRQELEFKQLISGTQLAAMAPPAPAPADDADDSPRSRCQWRDGNAVFPRHPPLTDRAHAAAYLRAHGFRWRYQDVWRCNRCENCGLHVKLVADLRVGPLTI